MHYGKKSLIAQGHLRVRIHHAIVVDPNSGKLLAWASVAG